MSDDRWKAEDRVCFSVYTPAITVGLASKQVRRIDLSYSPSLSSLSLCCSFGAVLPLISFYNLGWRSRDQGDHSIVVFHLLVD